MSPAIVSGIVTDDLPLSYWPIFSPFSRKLFGAVSSLLKRQMTVQIWNFVSSFIILACLRKARLLKCEPLFFFRRWDLVCRPRVPSEDRGNWG